MDGLSDMQSLFRRRPYEAAVSYVRARIPGSPLIALVLGSGLGDYAPLEGGLKIPGGDIPSYPRSTVSGHRGEIVFSRIAGKNVLAFRGRTHLYECNDLATVLFPVALAAALGVSVMIVTNASGGINRQFAPGDLMLITDQIDLTLHRERLPGERAGCGHFFDSELRTLALSAAARRALPLRQGVYASVKGPSYETAAEVEMLRRMGGDAVGMSTVKEVSLAARLGIRVLGISCITNKAAGTGGGKLDHSEVTEVAAKVRVRFADLVTECISDIPG
ncbi:MAG TPA: purine-nucleoside phosphorylase [Bacteroidota bacterium]|nr:purine-nucleoside phosphorylase [Bacteroidota bacterium]